MGIFFRARRSSVVSLRTVSFSVVVAFGVSLVTCAQEAVAPPAQYGGATSIRSGGVIEDSYYYHHLGPMRSAIEAGGIPQANGWYEYGFPMRSYRWGSFGAERHYPRVIWHDGYYGDCIRTAYR